MTSHKQKIIASFSRSAGQYDRHADIQKRMRRGLLKLVPVGCGRILDLGSGTGELAKELTGRIIGIDIAPGMVRVAKQKNKRKNVSFKVADAERLPFKRESFDLVVSNASVQWMNLRRAAKEAARVLRSNGEFCFATFGPKTLKEVKKAGLSVNDFPDQHRIKQLLSKYFNRTIITAKLIKKKYRNIFELFKYLQAIGAQSPRRVARRGLLTRRALTRMFKKGLSVTYQIYYVRGRK